MPSPIKAFDLVIKIPMTRSMYSAVRMAAARRGVPQSQYIRAAISEALERDDADGPTRTGRKTA